MITYLATDEMDMGTFAGVHAAWIGEDGDAIAFTDDRDAALASVIDMARRDLGHQNILTGEAEQTHMRFHIPEGYQSDEWQGERCASTDDGAHHVVIVREVIDEESARLLGSA
jgi:hypothetical protein